MSTTPTPPSSESKIPMKDLPPTKLKTTIGEVENLSQSSNPNNCTWQRALKIAATVFAAIALIVGTVGLLSYLGYLQIGWQGLGTMTSTTALYTTLAGLGASFVTSCLVGVSCLMSQAENHATSKVAIDDAAPESSWWCCGNYSQSQQTGA